MTGLMDLPISDEPIDEGDRWWARHVTPLVARLAAAHPDLFPALGTDGACLSSRAQAPQRDSRAGAPSYPGSTATVVPPTALASAQAARGGRPAPESAARAASPDTQEVAR